MADWGISAIGGTEAAFPNAVRVMGGVSPNIDNMTLSSISVHIGATASNEFRLAIYTGGTLSTGPDGATLLHDFGLTTVAANSWVTINAASDISVPKSTNLWLAWKGNDAVTTFTYGSTARGDFQSARGRYSTAVVSTDETVAYPATWPADTGTFASFWYDIYIIYAVAASGLGVRFRSGEGNLMTSTPTTFTAPANSSIAFWIYLLSYYSPFTRVLGTSNTYEIRIAPTTGILSNDMFQGTGFVSSITAIQLGVPYHVVCTRASDNSAAVFINGVSDNTGSTNDGTAPAGVIEFGRRPGISEFMDGYLMDVRFYDRVLSAAEVATMFACRGVDNITHGLLHRYILNELPQGTRTTGSGVAKDTGGATTINLTAATTTGSGPEYTGTTIKTKRLT